jgi:hypothetical protein
VFVHPVAQATVVRTPSVVVPASPLPFEVVNLRMGVDSCEFSPADVTVKTVANVIQVHVNENIACSPPGALVEADVRLGSYPEGTYSVEVVGSSNTLSGSVQRVVDRAQFTVNPRSPIPVGAARNFPLADYTGMWWNPQESGWGLSINQGASDALFGALFVYDAQGRAQWFTLQPGGWTTSTRWEGPLYRTTGPFHLGPTYEPSLVQVQAVGRAVLEFSTAPAGSTTARLTYTVDGVTTVKTITRMVF